MSNIKKAFQPLHKALKELTPNTTVKSILENPTIMGLMEASKGGFTGENSFVEIGGNKVARICAMTGAVFAHDNTDKEKSFFYKNGSYMIGAEIVKANARKAWEADKEAKETALEDQMLEGTLTPKEWKDEVTKLRASQFEFTLDDATKEQLIKDFDGYATKEDFIEAYENDAVPPFTDYADKVEALRDAGKPEEVEEETEEA